MTGAGDERRDTPLARKLKERIRRQGPITIADYMTACLHDPEHGYYRKRPAIGAGGDFITAPEISQVFGELIGLWCAIVWQEMGSPARLNLVELGPGRATLMRDALRAVRIVPGFLDAVSVHLVESSEVLRPVQAETLAASPVALHWHPTVEDLPPGAAVVVGNEFLDTLPGTQLVMTSRGWAERGVGLDAEGRLAFNILPALTLLHQGGGNSGAVLEQRDLAPLLDAIGERARRAPLAALFIDYGHLSAGPGDTLQAVRDHVHEHPLCSPGEADLTMEVNFEQLGVYAAAAGLAVDGPVTQAEFLGSLGIVERASRLMAANPAKAHDIEAGVARLLAPSGMGSRFKAVGLRSSELPKLPGFA